MDKAPVYGTGDSRFDPWQDQFLFFHFQGHGATPRVVSYVLAKFHIDPSSVEASAGVGAAACDAFGKKTSG